MRSRPTPGKSVLQFRQDNVISGVDVNTYEDACRFEVRMKDPGDPAVATAIYLRRYKGAATGVFIDVLCYTTKTYYGGIISGRCFTDLKWSHVTAHEVESGQKLTQVLSAFMTVPPEMAVMTGVQDWLKLAAKDGLVVARNLMGTGSLVQERIDGERRVIDRYGISQSEPGGRLPTSLINSATGSAIIDIESAIIRRLKFASILNTSHTLKPTLWPEQGQRHHAPAEIQLTSKSTDEEMDAGEAAEKQVLFLPDAIVVVEEEPAPAVGWCGLRQAC